MLLNTKFFTSPFYILIKFMRKKVVIILSKKDTKSGTNFLDVGLAPFLSLFF